MDTELCGDSSGNSALECLSVLAHIDKPQRLYLPMECVAQQTPCSLSGAMFAVGNLVTGIGRLNAR